MKGSGTFSKEKPNPKTKENESFYARFFETTNFSKETIAILFIIWWPYRDTMYFGLVKGHCNRSFRTKLKKNFIKKVSHSPFY